MHGRSLVPLLKGDKADWRKDWLYEYYEFPGPHSVRKHRGVRTERYKLMHYYEAPEEFELYDLQKDPQELTNLYGKAEHAELVKQLKQRIADLRKETGDK
jgi:arylsulfatase A-like enzyme